MPDIKERRHRDVRHRKVDVEIAPCHEPHRIAPANVRLPILAQNVEHTTPSEKAISFGSKRRILFDEFSRRHHPAPPNNPRTHSLRTASRTRFPLPSLSLTLAPRSINN